MPKIANSEIAKLAISFEWCAGISEVLIWELRQRYGLSEKTAHHKYIEFMRTGLVKIEHEEQPVPTELTKGRFVLCDGITQEML